MEELFIWVTKNTEKYEFYVFLINNTKKKYSKIYLLSGAFMSDGDSLIETSKIWKEFGELDLWSNILVDSSDLGELDFVIWYELDCVLDNGEIEKYKFDLHKLSIWTDEIPEINSVWTIINVKPRDGRFILDYVKDPNNKVKKR